MALFYHNWFKSVICCDGMSISVVSTPDDIGTVVSAPDIRLSDPVDSMEEHPKWMNLFIKPIPVRIAIRWLPILSYVSVCWCVPSMSSLLSENRLQSSTYAAFHSFLLSEVLFWQATTKRISPYNSTNNVHFQMVFTVSWLILDQPWKFNGS